MDRRAKTTFIKTALTAVVLACAPGFAGAQDSAPPEDGPATEGTNIFGNQELPKGLTIVPWKKNSPDSLSESPTRLVDEPLAPIDPEVFERRLKYYEQSRAQ